MLCHNDNIDMNRTWRRIMFYHRVILISFVCALVGPPALGEEPKPPSAPSVEPPDRAALEKQFQERMSGAVLVGSYTIKGQENEKPPQEEKYTLSRVTKLQGDLWLFAARIQFGEQDLTVPLPLEVKWAGDTPVISVTDVTIPGLGTFSSRVLIYRGQYAGTWKHGDVEGHLWGRITKEQPDREDKSSRGGAAD